MGSGPHVQGLMVDLFSAVTNEDAEGPTLWTSNKANGSAFRLWQTNSTFYIGSTNDAPLVVLRFSDVQEIVVWPY